MKEEKMKINNHEILYGINLNNNMGKIVNDGLNNQTVRELCMHFETNSYVETQKKQVEFSRFIGYCILFRNIQNIEQYMLLKNKDEQKKFLIKQIAKKMNIPENEITKRNKEIILFAFNNFKKNGYVFHGANSLSTINKMINGLRNNDVNIKEQEELLKIEDIYRKYNPNSKYSPLGHGATDIKENKTGWFFDGLPIHSTGYANSPQWFNYLCGKSYVYFENIPEQERNGYESRNYKKALSAISWLIEKENMDVEDKKEILNFFEKNWNRYEKATPCLIFIPVKEVKINEDITIEQYLSSEGVDRLFDDIISGTVNPIKNCCCKKMILPDKLSFVDLSLIFDHSKNEVNIIKKTNSLARNNENFER